MSPSTLGALPRLFGGMSVNAALVRRAAPRSAVLRPGIVASLQLQSRRGQATAASASASAAASPTPSSSHAPAKTEPAARPPPEPVQSLGRAADGRRLRVREYPVFASLEEERLYRKQHLAAAFRVFADRGFTEGVAGHISVRDPILTDHFWLNPLSTHFALIKVSDLILVNERGDVVVGDQPINAAAFAIHAAVHAARPRDVHAACHAHSVHGKAFSCFGRPLEMLTQDALRFYGCHGVYDDYGGVAVDEAEGRRIAAALGGGKAVILRNHGLLTVGRSVDEAAFWFLSLEASCQAQLLADAAAAGAGYEKRVISDEEAAYAVKQVGAPEKGWLAFQPYYDEMLARTKGDFLN